MQATPCANTSALNAYLREQERAEKRQNWIELEGAVKFAEMQPFKPTDIDEAIAETLADKAKRAPILVAFAGNDDAALGTAIRVAVKAYWLTFCESEAADAYDDGAAEALDKALNQ